MAQSANMDASELARDIAAGLASATTATERAALVPAELVEAIHQLKTQRDAVILAHYYAAPEVQAVADYVGDSFYLAKLAKSLPQQHILFIPDQNLGRFVAEQVPQKHVILNNGYCPRHHIITVEQIVDAQEAHPDALVLAHPECKADVLAEADYIGSTAGFIKYAEESDASEFIIVTVRGVLYELERRCQGTGKKFYFPAVQPTCVNMDLITLEKLVHCLETGEGEVQIGVSEEAADQAKLTLDRMLEYATR